MPAESLIPLLLCNTKIVFLRARLSALLCQTVGESKVGKKLLLLSLAFTVSHTDMTLQRHICQHPLSVFTVNNTLFLWQAISSHWKCPEYNSVQLKQHLQCHLRKGFSLELINNLMMKKIHLNYNLRGR